MEGGIEVNEFARSLRGRSSNYDDKISSKFPLVLEAKLVFLCFSRHSIRTEQ